MTKLIRPAIIVSRVGFCPLCAKEGSPKTNQFFVVFGNKTQTFHGRHVLHNGNPGFTPHIYRAKIVGENNVIVLINCGINDCGITNFYYTDIGTKFNFTFQNTVREVWTIQEWEALKKYNHDTDYEI